MFSPAVLRILGVLLTMFSTTLIPPFMIAWMGRDSGTAAFGLAFLGTITAGAALWFSCRNQKRELRVRDGFLIVVLFLGSARCLWHRPILAVAVPRARSGRCLV